MNLPPESDQYETSLHELDGRKVKRLRMSKGWSRSVMAMKLNVLRKSIGSYEKDLALVTKAQLLDICLLFAVHPKQLVFGSDSQAQARKDAIRRKEQAILARRRATGTKPKTKKKKRTAKSVPRRLMYRSAFESNRRKH
jgi:transcriptional regulator with XRE-family HTH domain